MSPCSSDTLVECPTFPNVDDAVNTLAGLPKLKRVMLVVQTMVRQWTFVVDTAYGA
jgi:hypothetical protein